MSIVSEIAEVAGDVQPLAVDYGQAAWDPDTKTVLWVCGDGTSTDDLDTVEALFLAVDGVEGFDYEYESMPDGWCAATPVYGGDPFGEQCEERAQAAQTGVGIPARVHYRDSTDPAEACGTCVYYASGHCRMFTGDPVVSPSKVCDEWTAVTSDHALTAALPRRPVGHVPISVHNAAAEATQRRLDVLEPRLAGILQPILSDAGTRAANAFRRLATNHLTAAGSDPDWSSPAGDELVDVPALVATLRTKTDPIRLAFLEQAMTPSLRAAGISFDVTNPLTAQVIAQSGSQITHIAETTRLNVMRTISESYKQGLSIPDTAKAIQEGMREASFTRATTIARTEMAGAAQGGILAAVKIVNDTTGQTHYKVWGTAVGAMYPRHYDYDNLNGQTVDLDSTFVVGDADLQFPGDPSGPPGETVNCRCSLSFSEDASQLTNGGSGID